MEVEDNAVVVEAEDAPEQEMLDYGTEGQEPSVPEEQAQGAEGDKPDTGAGPQPDAVNSAEHPDDVQPTDQAQPTDESKGTVTDPMALPPHGTEVFVSRLPREATEAQVQAFCEKAGEVHSLRLPKDPGNSTLNRGFVFCVYKTPESAETALNTLHQEELADFPGKKVNAVRSEAKNKLFVGNLPRDMGKDAIFGVLEAETKGVINLELMADKETGASRGFGFVEYYNHTAAELARKALGRPGFKVGGRELTVTWAEPKRSDQAAETIKALHVSGLPDTADEAKIRELFTAFGKINQVVVLRQNDDPTKLRGYAFVHFAERAHALKVVTDVDGGKVFEMDGKQLGVHLAKPQISRDGYDDDRYARGGPGSSRGGYGRGGGGRGYGPPGRGGRGGGGGFRGGYTGRGGYSGSAMGGGGYEDGFSGYGGYGGYDDGGYDGGYGGIGGYGYGGMMLPMMLPGGGMAYMMAGANGGGGMMGGVGGGGGAGVPARRGGSGGGRGAGGAPRVGPAAARGGATGYGGRTGYGAPAAAGRGGATPAAGGGGGYVPRGYAAGAGGRGARYAPY